MVRKLRRLSEFSPGELLVLLQLCLFSLMVKVGLRFLPLPRMMECAAHCAKHRWLRFFPLFKNRYEITRLTRLADIAARNTRADGPCLLRSLLIFWLLKARGEHAELLVGVRKEASAINSHAWIESQGKVIGDSAESALHFATLLRF